MKKTILAAAIVILSIVAISCGDVSTSPSDINMMRIQHTVITAETSDPQEIEIPKDTVKRDRVGRKKDTIENPRDTDRKVPPTIFGDLLIKLNLSPEQRVIVEKLLAEHKSCTENCTKILRTAESEVMEKARRQEKEIKDALKAGRITKEQAKQRLDALKSKTDAELKNLPVRKSVQECMQSCDASFINSLERILSQNQKIILKKWIYSKSKRGTTERKDTVVVKPRG